jgi:hypothetical protein
MKKKARRSPAKKKSKPNRTPKLDASQSALAMIEHIIGGKSANRK